jgi:exopolyphosphatase/guanosine-5'-triphosphate,3'-diphosphate pyrophosphatase
VVEQSPKGALVPEEAAQRPSRRARNQIAAVDCGTNTIKLFIGTPPRAAVRQSRMVRLGQGVDRTGRLADDALARAFAAVEGYAVLVAQHGIPPERIRFCATSATRDAANGDVFAQGVHQRLGVWPEVLTGAEEAALAFDGAVRALRDATAEPVLVIDVGGGSTELILGTTTPSRSVTASHSMDIGAVRLHERHLHRDPPTSDQVAACVADIEAALDDCPVDVGEAALVVGLAGTVITVASGVLGLSAYDPRRTDQAVIEVAGVHEYVAWLVGRTVAERLALPYMHPGRADVIDAGALILDRVLRRTKVSTLTVSEADILDGIAWSVAEASR